jgi:predicted ester cyclase
VVVRWTGHGTHTGNLMGVAPTHMKVTVHGMDIYRVSEGKIQEIWISWDAMGFMQQLGLEPLSSTAEV